MQRSVLVTGATSGIGFETAVEAARLGFHVVATARSQEKADDLRRAAKVRGATLDTLVLDLHDPEAGSDEIPALDLWGLVNNAGYMNAGAVEDVPLADARQQFEAMVFAPARLAQLALPAMRRRGEGRIVNIGSVSSWTTGPMIGWYQATKHALKALNDALRAEVEDHGTDVVLVEPGGFRTAIWPKARRELEARREGSPYPAAYERALSILDTLEPVMPSAEGVAKVVGEVLVAGRPRPRYRVGTDAFILEAADAVLPARLKDRAVKALLRL
ncbi:MAG TPA: SDR family oxidoreductase [Acidimicrobiia bacterium]|nr:SDR family oxidoreductase [Acidimicrobiia bacterium]